MEFKLTKNQQACFDAIENSNENFLIHGKPGVGKSVLINHLTTHGYKSYTLAAPTGLAALNIGGKTLHSIFRLPVSHGIVHPLFDNYPVDQRVINNIKYNIKHLIIDEVSMVRADMFDYIDRLMRFAKEVEKPFGGAQVIIIGDFYQLPPVVVRDEVPQLRDAGFSSAFVFSSKVFQNSFKILHLNEVLRQKGDPTFINILNNARDGSITPKQTAILNKKVGNPGDIRIKLTCTNKEADFVNYRELKKIEAESKIFEASVFGEWPANPVERTLELKIGAQVMVKKNKADFPASYRGNRDESQVVNGSLGVVTEFGENYEGEKYVRIRLENDEEVNIYTQRFERKIKERDGDKFTERLVASFEQVPLQLSWAISIHKSQGQSFDKVHIDATKVFAPGQLYVALSRCRSLDGLSLEKPVTTKQFWANLDVIRFFNDLEVGV